MYCIIQAFFIKSILIIPGIYSFALTVPPASQNPDYFDGLSLEALVLAVIFCILSVTVLFFFLTLFTKINRIKEIRRKEKYQKKIDELLFNLLFEEQSVQEIIGSIDFQDHKHIRFFQQLTIKTMIGLHHNYSGNYSIKMEQFFAESGLSAYSLAKLNSKNWAHIVEGIRDLSSLNYMPAYPRIVSYKNHSNKNVKTEVLLGMIKMKGISELLKFKKSKVYFNDWVQSNILFVIKNYKIPAPENLSELLESKNRSILLLAVRLINYYGSPQHYMSLAGFYERTNDPLLKNEIALLLDRTEQLQ